MGSTTLWLILLTVAIVSLIDYVPRVIISRKKPIKPQAAFTKVPKYLIMPTVYGDISYLQNVAFLRKYASKVVICTSEHETPEFYRELRRVCRRYGFRYTKAALPMVKGRPVKNAYTIYKGALANLRKLGITKSTPCLLIDADTYAEENVNNLIRAFEKSGYDIASLRCEAAKPRTVIEKLQAYEYRLAMDNRRMDPWLTSGACNLGKAGVLQHVFSRHSHFFAGGDIEIGKLAQVMGYKVNHLDFTFYTALPNTFKEWFNQRIIWFAGGVRHHVANIGSFGWHHFFIFFYNSLIVYLLFPVRWIEIVNFPLTMVALVIFGWVYTFLLTFRRGWQPVYLLLPAYSFIQSMIILPVAIGRYCKLAWKQRSLGVLKYDLSRFSMRNRMLFKVLNVASAAFVVYIAFNFTLIRLLYWAKNGIFAFL